MKHRIKLIFLFILLLCSYGIFSQTVVVTLNWSTGWCSICSGPTGNYSCSHGMSGGGQWNNGIRTFADPVPPGNCVTGVSAVVNKVDCGLSNACVNINGTAIGPCLPITPGSNCNCGACWPQTYSATWPCGMPGYVYGGINSFQYVPNASCVCVASAVITITYAPCTNGVPAQPGPITGATVVCPGQTFTYSVPAVPGATSYNWTVPPGATIVSGQGTTTITVTFGGSVGNICVTATNGCGTSTPGCIAITLAPPLTITIVPPSASICSGDNVVLTASGGNTYTWSPGTGLSGTTGSVVTATPVTTTTYTVTGTVGSCTGTSAVTITVNPSPVITVTPASPSICLGSSVTLTANSASTYEWSPGTGLSATTGATVSANPIITTTYTIIGTDVNGCKDTTTVLVTVNPIPVVSISPPNGTMCIGQSLALTGNGATTYEWSPGTGLSATTGTTVTANPITTTTYTVTGTSLGCTATATTTITLNPGLSINLSSNDLSICEGENTIISGTATGGDGGPYTYTWDNGLGTMTPPITVTPITTTTYNVTVSDNCGTPVATDNITIVVNPTPTINFTALPLNGCAPLDVDFVSNCTPTIQGYLWNFGDPGSGNNTSVQSNPSHQFQYPGTYDITLTATSTDGCVNTFTINQMITSAPKPTADFTPTPSTTTMDNPTISFYDNSSNTNIWLWNFGDPASPLGNASSEQSPTHIYSNEGTYTIWLTVESSAGCKDSTSRELIIKDEYTFFAPDAFTPDGDGLNDYFTPTGVNIDINNFEMYIYDRWGVEVYKTKDLSKPWNGKHKNIGDVVPQGVYIWMAKIFDNKGKDHIIYGKVTLIR